LQYHSKHREVDSGKANKGKKGRTSADRKTVYYGFMYKILGVA